MLGGECGHEMPRIAVPFSRKQVSYVMSSVFLCLVLSSFIRGRVSYGLGWPQIHYATENDIEFLILQAPPPPPATLGMLGCRAFYMVLGI